MSTRTIPLSEALIEVSSGVGPAWTRYRVLGATRAGLALAKEPVGKAPERYKLVEPGTIFYNPMRILIGSIAMLDDGEEPGITSPDYVVVRTRPGVLHHRWFYHWLRSEQGAEMIRSLARGAVRERLLFKRLARGAVTIPDWDSQVRAADKLAIIQKARAAAAAQLEAAKALPAAYLRQVFESPEARTWKIRKLGDVCHIQLGKMLSPKSKTGLRARPYLRNANVQWNRFDLSSVLTMDFSEREEAKFALRAGDLMVCEGGDPGRAAVWGDQISPCFYQKALHRLRFDPAIGNPHFFLYRIWYAASIGEFSGSNAKTTIAHLPAVRLATLEVRVPPLEEQKALSVALGRRIENTEGLIKGLQQQLETVDRLGSITPKGAFEAIP
jgi:restriction endonuclease S subunit